jgi:tRNA(fMet)-specific endonuclease VapC
VKYLLDTNACVALMKGTPPAVRFRLGKACSEGSEVFVPVVVLFELWCGAAKSSQEDANFRRVETFFAGPVSVLPFDQDDARAAGAIRADLEGAGKPIGAYDLLIAGQALRRDLTLVTANTREFARVKGLLWEDWAK